MAWLTQSQLARYISLLIMLGSFMLAHNDQLPPVLQPYQGWIEFLTGVLTVVAAWIIQPPPPMQPPRQEWTPEQRAANNADQEKKP